MSLSVSWKRSSSFFGSLAMLASNTLNVGCRVRFGVNDSGPTEAQPEAGAHEILHRMSVFCPTREVLFGSGAGVTPIRQQAAKICGARRVSGKRQAGRTVTCGMSAQAGR